MAVKHETRHEKSLLVALRLRPLNYNELKAGARKIAHTVDSNLVVVLDPSTDRDDILRANRSKEKHYVFDFAFDQTANQDDVYGATTKHLVQDVLSGFNVTVFAYGPTGTGKTYTMLGTPCNPGIMVLTLNDLFHQMKLTEGDVIYGVTMSYMEIYNEMIRDLLDPKRGFLELREDSNGEIIVSGLSEIEATSTVQVMDLLNKGNLCRTCEPTSVNQTSSRSHAILKVVVRSRNRVMDVTQSIHTGCLFMVDLAGSERASITKNRGKRMVEGAHINRSLLALGNVINALATVQGKVPYVNFRDSKLTRILKESLGGNAKTVMIAHISPASTSFEESRNTLNYAERSRNIKTKVHQNVFEAHYHILQYQEIIAELRRKITSLKEKLHQCQCSKKQEYDVLLQYQDKMLSDQKHLRQSISTFKYYLAQNLMEIQKCQLETMEWKLKNSDKELDTLCTAENTYDCIDKLLASHSEEQDENLQKIMTKMSSLVENRKQLESHKLLLEKQLTECNTKLSELYGNLVKIPLRHRQSFLYAPNLHEVQCRAIQLEQEIMLSSLKLSLQDKTINELQNQTSSALNLAEKQYALLQENSIQLPESLQKQMEELQIQHSLLQLQVEATNSQHTSFEELVLAPEDLFSEAQKKEKINSDLQLPKINVDSGDLGKDHQWTTTLPFRETESCIFHNVSKPETSPWTGLFPVDGSQAKTVSKTFISLPILNPKDVIASQTNSLTKVSLFSSPQKVASHSTLETIEIESIRTASVSSLNTIKSQSHIPKQSIKPQIKKKVLADKKTVAHTSSKKESSRLSYTHTTKKVASTNTFSSPRRQPMRNQSVRSILVPHKISAGCNFNSPYQNSTTTRKPRKTSSFVFKVNNKKDCTTTSNQC